MKKQLNMKDVCRIVMIILMMGTVLVNIKSIFTDFDIDTEYAMAMSYRMILGDRMFLQMWEPHQTSAFLCTFLMNIYVTLVGSTTGCAVFLQLTGVLIHVVIGLSIYLFLKKRVDNHLAQLMVLFFLVVRPKDIVFPEFSNMQIWFSILLFLCLVVYFECGKKRWLLAASVCLCLEIISYPSCLVVYFAVIIILAVYTKNKVKDILIFSGSCAVQGICYVLFFVGRIGLNQFIENIGKIIVADGSHGSEGYYAGENFFAFFRKSLVEFGICLFLAVVINFILRRCFRKCKLVKEHNFFWTGLLMFSICYTITDFLYVLIYRERFSYIILFVLIVISIFAGFKYCTKSEKCMVVTGGIISFGSFAATLMLTNLDFLSIVKYLVLAVMVSMIPLSRILDQKIKADCVLVRWFVLFCFMFLLIFRRGMIVKTLDGLPSNIFDLGGIIKSGPAMGIISDYVGAYSENCSREEWSNYVKDNDNVLLVGRDNVNTLAYLYENINVSAASTICTPTYNDMLLEYWKMNPQKRPNLIMVQCWYGDLHVDENSWIMQWINSEFQPNTYMDGKYWRYYRLSEE